MERLLKIVGAILVCLALVLVALRITGLDSHNRLPGLWLKGDLVSPVEREGVLQTKAKKYPQLKIPANATVQVFLVVG